MLSPSSEDYLKTIYELNAGQGRAVPSQVAEKLAVSPAAVTKMAQRLQEKKMVQYSRQKGFTMTQAGEKAALKVIRRHRLLELYLTEALHFAWDRVHEEACRMEHVISDEFEEKIDEFLGRPTRDPHGAPIPTKDGRIEEERHPKLAELPLGRTGTIQQVDNDNAELLRYAGAMGMIPGAEVEMLNQEPFGGPFHIRVAGKKRAVGQELMRHISVAIKE
ncbi:MAG: metal-dependent transcriptional regulator [Candidatus Omnitrophota bacterium]